LIEPPGRIEYPLGSATVFAFSIELRLVQGHWDFWWWVYALVV